MERNHLRAAVLFPAHAGVILYVVREHTNDDTIPRTRGGDKAMFHQMNFQKHYSPHTRG